VGTVAPLGLRRRDFEPKLLMPNFARALRDVGVATFDDLLKLYTAAGPDALREFVGDGPILNRRPPFCSSTS
jgi:hypothetical protein